MPAESDVVPFTIEVSPQERAELRGRLNSTRWDDGLPSAGWDYGVEPNYLRQLAEYWADGYSWAHHEARLNELPQFRTAIDGQQIHFVHLRSTEPDATPLLMTHGWPSTFADFAGLVGPLAEPTQHGAPGQPAFDLIVPSLPGFGFSGPTSDRGWDVDRIGRCWTQLMDRLGYGAYMVQGGDWGSLVAPAVGAAAPERVIGVHINAMINGSNVDWDDPASFDGLGDEDIVHIQDAQAAWKERRGYALLQATRPQTLAYALNDSPVGLLA